MTGRLSPIYVLYLWTVGDDSQTSNLLPSGYDAESSQGYHLVKSFDVMLESGPLIRPGASTQEEEAEDEGTSSSPQEEDLHSLLVKAWEAKVFPVIQRRFRNDQERKSGLDQIKGALQLGELELMADQGLFEVISIYMPYPQAWRALPRKQWSSSMKRTEDSQRTSTCLQWMT